MAAVLPWLFLATIARAAPEDVLDPMLHRFYQEGQAFERDGRPAAAAVRYRYVMEAEPTWHQAALDLGRVLADAGRPEEAIAVYERLRTFDADAAEALGRLLLSEGRAPEAADVFRQLRDLRPEWPGTRVLEASARASTEPDLAAGMLEEYIEFAAIDPAADGLASAAAEVAAALRARGDHAAARGLLQDVLARADAPELLETLAEIEVDLQATALAEAGDVPLDAEQLDRLRRAREAIAAGRAAEAREALEALCREQPLSAAVWGALANAREATGDVAGAEQAVRAAERLDPLSAAWPAKLGRLLFTWYGGRYDADAADAYGRAVLRRPDAPDLWFEKATAERRAGAWARSVVSFERFVALEPTGPRADEARRAIEGTRRQRPPPPVLPSAEARPPSVPEDAWWAYHRARAWKERTEPYAGDRALAELAVARERAPGFVKALDLEAALRVERGELASAVAAYEESLRREPDRVGVTSTLAGLYEQVGRPAEAEVLRDRAAALGDPDALLRRAQAQVQAWQWASARRTLAEFFAQSATPSGAAWEAALALDAELVRWRNTRIGMVMAACGLLAIPFGVQARRRSGVTLEVLLAHAPRTWPEVARICSAIRHEVLRHHTAVLPGVADALDAGDPEPARWVAARLFGTGALARLDGYVGELEALGRSNGVRLSLRYRDPVFAPMLGHVARLRRFRSALRAGRGHRLASALRVIDDGLNRDAYHALGRLVAGLCVLEVGPELVREIYDAVRSEPAFRDTPAPELVLEAGSEVLFARIFRSDLTDILANLLRNAVQASLPSGATEIGVALGAEEDEITALDRVVIRIRDRAPGTLTTASLRGRYVARGLGLAVDLTSRASGSIHVETEPGWAKAVVVRLPRAEIPREEET